MRQGEERVPLRTSKHVFLETRRHAHQHKIGVAMLFFQGIAHRRGTRLCRLRRVVICSARPGGVAVDVDDAEEAEPRTLSRGEGKGLGMVIGTAMRTPDEACCFGHDAATRGAAMDGGAWCQGPKHLSVCHHTWDQYD